MGLMKAERETVLRWDEEDRVVSLYSARPDLRLRRDVFGPRYALRPHGDLRAELSSWDDGPGRSRG
jgi:hypothetical protein